MKNVVLTVLTIAFLALLSPARLLAEEADSTTTTDEVTPSENNATTESKTEAPSEYRQPNALKLGGALRFNTFYKTYDPSHTTKGFEMAVDTFRFNVDLFYKGMLMNAEYRFYDGYSMLKQAYVGYAYRDLLEFQVGIVQAPFGNLTYASHNYFFILPYYAGLEDDHDLGLKFACTLDRWSLMAAYMVNDEGSFTGNSADSARYSYDIVRESIDVDGDGTADYDGQHEEMHEGNLRLAYTFGETASGQVELGVSGKLGGLYNRQTDAYGIHYAAAGHLNADVKGFNIKLEGLYYAYEPDSDNAEAVVMGAYDAPYLVARRAAIVGGGVAYTLPINENLVDYIQFYVDGSYMLKPAKGYYDTVMISPGFLLAATYIYMYSDVHIARHHPWLGGDWTRSMAAGGANHDFEVRVNVNLGFYYSGTIDL